MCTLACVSRSKRLFPLLLFAAGFASTAAAQSARDSLLEWIGPAEPSSELSAKQRFHAYLLNTVGPVPLVGEAIGAGIWTAAKSPPEWGQDWKGFGQRYGTNLGYNAIRQTVDYGISEALRLDDRYFASQQHGFWRRTRHAVVATFTAQTRDGGTTVSVGGIAGVFAASAISSIWSPPSLKGPGNIAANAGFSFAFTAGLNVGREFLPDLLRRKH